SFLRCRVSTEKRDDCTTNNGDTIASSRVHSITSSARASSVGGTSRPSALAVFRLITNSNFVVRSMGISAETAPFKLGFTEQRLIALRRATRTISGGPRVPGHCPTHGRCPGGYPRAPWFKTLEG